MSNTATFQPMRKAVNAERRALLLKNCSQHEFKIIQYVLKGHLTVSDASNLIDFKTIGNKFREIGISYNDLY